jgi:hypothetical protein
MTDIIRDGVTYRQLPNGTITCGPLDQSGKLGGTGEQSRNDEHNPTRFLRIGEYHPDPLVLDYGCGQGLFVDFLIRSGVKAVGYDKYGISDGKYLFNIPGAFPREHFDVVTMIEVIEHMAAPFIELDWIFITLKPGGILMIETSFTDWMDLATDPYVNPRIGHSTIFSHAGLDELMKEKGFEVYGHINRNVRVYQKPGAPVFSPKITLVTMGQANPKALRKTLNSFRDVVDEVIFGDLLIFGDDRTIIQAYREEFILKIVEYPFNYIFMNGFAATLNSLATYATNDWILYMNVSEVMDGDHPIKAQMSEDYNCYSFDHAVDPHRWFRLYNKKELHWSGLIHEEVVGDERRCPFNVFRMKDEEKDLDDPFKAKVANDVKELCYWEQFRELVEQPELRATTHPGWIQHAEEAYQSHMDRMAAKGKRWQAFKEGNLTMYLEDVYTNPEFEKERFESSELFNFQGDRKLL